MKWIVYCLFVPILLAVQITSAHAQPACSSTNDNSCAVYSDCIEANCNCNNTNYHYVEKFGFKYCQRFGASTAFSEQGAKWRDKTLSCLKDRISAAYVKNGCNCAAIQKEAIASHNECYIASPSFCKLSDDDIRVIARIVEISDILAIGTQGVGETAKTLVGCYQTESFDRAKAVVTTFGDETLNEGGEVARNYIVDVMAEGERLARNAGLENVADVFQSLVERYRKKLP